MVSNQGKRIGQSLFRIWFHVAGFMLYKPGVGCVWGWWCVGATTSGCRCPISATKQLDRLSKAYGQCPQANRSFLGYKDQGIKPHRAISSWSISSRGQLKRLRESHHGLAMPWGWLAASSQSTALKGTPPFPSAI